MAGAPTGNQNAKKGKAWFDALRKECVQRDTLATLAKLVVDKAENGEQWAITEITTRFDGKPAQAVELSGPDGDPMEINGQVTLSPAEAYARLANG